ncbi:MAG TPA: J domain-containing protein [Chloroflexota bacterium]|jgi:curved DNA-binding protein CbpA|nr:J domain-containing protein [Chloroflexota bacterium]
MRNEDCYAILGVPTTASEKEIRTAYRRLARRFHPDLNAGDKNAAERFKRIKAAYDTLADPVRRRRYDELRARRSSPRPARRAQTAAGAPGPPHLLRVRRSEGELTVEVGLGLSRLLDLIAVVRVGGQRPADEE